MKKSYSFKILQLAFSLLLLGSTAYGQSNLLQKGSAQEPCKTHLIHNQLLNSDPVYKQRIFDNEAIIQDVIKNPGKYGVSRGTVYSIPVVVHVIHLGEAIGSGTNISDAQIQSAITSLNEAFRKLTGTIYYGNGVDTEIEFCLAVRDPNNQPHSGINRVNGSGTSDYASNGITNDAGSSMNETTIKALSKWSNTSYYNIWIVSEIDNNNGGAGTQGYAYFPGAGPTVDGAVILYNAFGTVGNLKSYTDKNMTAIHELGHGLDLYHTFEGGSCSESNCATQGDLCCDTPPHIGSNTNCGTPECSGTQPVKNYMDYTGEDCTNMFTANQTTRMRAALTGTRSGLLSSSGCTPVYGLDAGISQIFKPASSACGSSIIPQVELKNYGSTTVTSATITYVINGVSNTYSWTGSLAASTTTTVNLPSINLNSGSNTFSAATSLPNGSTDQNTSNDNKSVTSTVTVGNGVTLTLTLDNFGSETTWSLKNSSGTTLYSGGPYTDGNDGAVITENWCLADGCYDFVINDVYSDGICCSNGNGSYQLVDDKTTTVLASGASFGATETKNFCVPLSAPVSDFSGSTGVCVGSTVTFTDLSTMSPTTWIWTFSGGSPTSSTSQNPSVTYSTAGTYSVTLTASNGVGTGTTETKTDYITVLSSPASACAVNTTNLSNSYGMGITNVTLNTINNTTGGAVADGGYEDFTCTQSTTLIPGNSYPISVKVGTANSENVKVYIDYNNNGVLTDAGELVFTSAAASGTHSGTVNTPTSVSKNKMLRMRVMSDFSTISGPCYSPQYGQVEDYGVIFYGVPTPPVANFSTSASTICAGESISFTDLSTNSPTSWSWTINGGSPSSSSSQNPSATFATAGTYDITLTATNDDGSDSETKQITVNATPSTPTASSNGPVCVGQALTLTSSTVTGATYSWTGPNGYTSSSQNPTVSASATTAMAGTYSVTATTNGCASAAGTTVVTINSNDNATISYSGSSYCKNGTNPTPTITGTTGGTFSSSAGLTINASSGLITLSTSTAGTYTVTYATSSSCPTTTTTSITINDYPTLSSPTTVDANCGGSNGSITVSGSNGSTPYTYSINGTTFQSGGTFSNVSAGAYTVTIKDANNCTNTASATVSDQSNLTATISSQSNIDCYGANNGSATIQGGGSSGYTYSSDGSSFGASGSFTGLSAGSYTLTVKDVNNCTASQSVTITEPTQITLSATTNNASCGSSNGSITATASGGTGALTYSIDGSNFQSSGSFTNIAAGSYTVTVKDASGCTKTSSVTVSSTGGLSASITSQTNVTCNGGSNGSVTVQGSGSSGYTYSNNGGAYQASGTFTSLSAGTYNITVKDGSGCVAAQSVTITTPTAISISASSTNTSCGNANGSITASATGGTGALTYSINGTTFQSTGNFTNLAAGNYTVTVKDANSCTSTKSVTIIDLSGLSASISSQTNNNCYGTSSGSVTIQGSGSSGYTYSKNGGTYQASGTFSNLAAGSYTITVKDVNGCTVTQTVTITQPTQLSVSATATGSSCGSSNGTITASGSGGTGALTYSIDGANFQASGSFSNLSAGNYTVTIKDANGCTKTTTATVNDLSGLSASITSQTDVSCNGLNDGSVTVQGSGTSGYTYSINGTTFVTSGSFGSLSAGNYTITIKDVNNCTITQSVTITQPNVLSVSGSGSGASCGNSNGGLTATGNGGTSPLTYSIDGATFQSSGTFTNLPAATYTVTVKDGNNCTATSSVTVSDLGTLTASIASQTNVSCFGGSNGSVMIQGNGTSGYEYSKDGVSFQTNGNFSGLTSGSYTFTVKDQNGCTATQNATITEPTQLSLSVASTTDASCGNSDGSIDLSGSGGTGTLMYNLNGGTSQASTTFGSLIPGTYSITVQDDNGCTNNISATVNDQSGLTLSISNQSDVSCNGNSDASVELSGNGSSGYTYSIDGANFQASGVFSNLSAGVYTAMVKDINDCPVSQFVTITEPTAVSAGITSQSDATCGDPNGSFTVQAYGGGSGYTYSTDGISYSASSSYTNLNAGTYIVYIQDANGCSDTVSVDIADLSGLGMNVTSTVDINCNGGNTGSITVEGTGTSGYYYSIDGINYTSNGSFIYLVAGNYDISVIDVNNCTYSQSATLIEPAILSITVDNYTSASCNASNGSIEVSASGGSPAYQYSINGGSNQSSGLFSGYAAGTYLMSVTDANNCLGTTSFTLSNTADISITITGGQNICEGQSTTLTAQASGGTGPYLYDWSDNSTTQSISITPSSSTTYDVTVSNSEGCSASSSATVTVNAKPTTSVTSSQSACAGESVDLTASGGSSYFWVSGETTASITVNPATTTTYSVVAITNGCQGNVATTTVTVISSPDAVAESNTTTTYLGDGGTVVFSNQSANATSVEWNFGDNTSVTSEKNPVHQFVAAGVFNVVLTAYNGNCTDTDTIAVTVLNGVGVEEISLENAILILPNPTSGKATLEIIDNSRAYAITIYNGIGDIIDSFKSTEMKNGMQLIDLSDNAGGVYYIKVDSENDCSVKKLVLIK